jgi:hypothetical protein
MHPFCNELALRERAAIRAHARALEVRTTALYGTWAAVVLVAYALGLLAGVGVSL